MKGFLHLMFAVAFISGCASKNNFQNKDRNINLVIYDDQYYKFDLGKETYSVYFVRFHPRDTIFHLTKEERESIIDKYYELGIDEIGGGKDSVSNLIIDADCTKLPKQYGKILAKTKTYSHVMQVDITCDNFSSDKEDEAEKLKDFIVFVENIVKSKPEVQAAPVSDIPRF